MRLAWGPIIRGRSVVNTADEAGGGDTCVTEGSWALRVIPRKTCCVWNNLSTAVACLQQNGTCFGGMCVYLLSDHRIHFLALGYPGHNQLVHQDIVIL